MIKSEQLTTLGFGIPNLLKFGEVGYFPEQFIVDMGLQGKTALEIKRFFMSYDVMLFIVGMTTQVIFVDLKHNVFIKVSLGVLDPFDEEEK